VGDVIYTAPGTLPRRVPMFVFLVWSFVALLPAGEPPQLWTALANMPALGKVCRRDCILHLFRRQAGAGMRLSELAHLLGEPAWLKDEDVSQFIILGGHVPVNWTPGDSLYSIRIFPELGDEMGAVYLVVSGETDYRGGEHLARFLRGMGGEDLKDRVILEIGYYEAERKRHLPFSPPLAPTR
jgi:hypothetical protein